MSRWLLLGALLFGSSNGDIVVSQDIAKKWDARCVDGTNPSYKLSRHPSSNQWVVMLEGMGWAWAFTQEDVKHHAAALRAIQGTYPSHDPSAAPEEVPREPGNDRSQREWPEAETQYLGGILSNDREINPDFASWNKVFVHYCDFSGFASNRDEPILIDDRDGNPMWMYFRGRKNFNAVIDHLVDVVGMSSATEVVLGGVSSGAASVFNLVDHFATFLGPHTRLTGFSDAGMFLDKPSVKDGRRKLSELMETSDKVWNITGAGNVNQHCADAHPTEKWKCLMSEYVAPLVETPIFILNSKFDYWAMMADFEQESFDSCLIDVWGTQDCSSDEFNHGLKTWSESLTTAVELVMKSNPLNGAYIDSCPVHVQSLSYCGQDSSPNCVGWHPEMEGNRKFGWTTSVEVQGQRITPQQAFGDYYFKRTDNNVIIDPSWVNHNPSCTYASQNIQTSIKPALSPTEYRQRYGGPSFLGGSNPFDEYGLPMHTSQTISPVRRLRHFN